MATSYCPRYWAAGLGTYFFNIMSQLLKHILVLIKYGDYRIFATDYATILCTVHVSSGLQSYP